MQLGVVGIRPGRSLGYALGACPSVRDVPLAAFGSRSHRGGKRLHGQAADSRGRAWPDCRCRRCAAPAVVADEVEAGLCRRIRRAVLQVDVIELARDELRKRLALPRDDGKLRRRLEQRRERLSQLFAWGDLTETEYRRQKIEVERHLTMLPDDDRLVLFDRHRWLLVSMAENGAAAPLSSSGSLP